MTALYWTLGLVALQRLIELAHARNNTARLRRLGAVEEDAGGYPLYFLLHAGWLASLAVFVPAATPPYWSLIGVFGLLFSQQTTGTGIIILGILIQISNACLSFSFHAYQAEIFPTRIRARSVGCPEQPRTGQRSRSRRPQPEAWRQSWRRSRGRSSASTWPRATRFGPASSSSSWRR